MLIAIVGGCASAAKPIFAAPAVELVWPAPPARPRIRYVGELKSSADLKARRGFFQSLGAVVAGPKEPELLFGPRAAVVTPDGERVWIADPGGRCLHMFDLARRRYLRVRGPESDALLSPVGLALGPENTLLVCDSEAVAIHRFADADGRWLGRLRLPEDVLRPVAMHYDQVASELYVVDVIAHDIKVLNVDGSLHRVLGQRGEGPGEFNFPSSIAASGDRLWIADTGNNRVQCVAKSGEPVSSFGQVGDAPGDLAMPKGIAIDAAENVYVVDGRFENIQIFDQQGQLLLFFGEEGTGPGQFWLPGGIFIEPAGRIWVGDAYNRRMQVFQYVGGQDSD